MIPLCKDEHVNIFQNPRTTETTRINSWLKYLSRM